MCIQIPLSKGYVSLIDEDDYDLIAPHTWSAAIRGSKIYAVTNLRVDPTRKKSVLMHRFLMKVVDPKVQIDHYNGDGLDNRRANLRLASAAGNNRNRSFTPGSSSKGVRFHYGSWHAYIKVDSKFIHLGTFSSKIEAMHAYDEAAIQHFGEFAALNFERGGFRHAGSFA